nr:unnamed protein product [Callosobruchus chinensis]CAH7764593.1 unnamed protein product [Callosobruchus chinensis]
MQSREEQFDSSVTQP